MNSLFKKEIKKVRENQSRRPIVLRWAFVNTIFCFVVFTIFSVLIYQITVTTYVNEEKSGIMTAMDNVDDTLNKSDVPLTLQNLHNFIQFNKVTPSHTEDETLKTLNSMVGHRRSFYIYDVDKRLLYTTAKTAMDFQNKPNN